MALQPSTFEVVTRKDLTKFARGAWEITPADSDMTNEARGIYVGGGGDVKVTTSSGDVVTFKGVPGGTLLPVIAIRVWSTGTTADSLVAIR